MALSFGGTDNNLASFENAKVVVLPVPYGKTVSYRKGTEKGPAAILEASDKMELFDEELDREPYRVGINTADLLGVEDLEPGDMINTVEKKVSDIFKHNKMPVILGGEHSVTIGAAAASKKRYKDLSILYFDAHCDIRDAFEGFRYSHACVARRLLEIAPVVEAGVRSLSREEKDFLSSNNIRVVTMSDIGGNPNWYLGVKDELTKDVYISIDLDVFDTSIMPSVGTPEPGGMGWYEFLKALRYIISGKNIAGFDVVELCPIEDIIGPDYMAARLIYKLIGYIFT